MDNYTSILKVGMQRLCNIDSDDKLEKLFKFMDMVLETNKSMNLTAITDKKDFIIKHYLDSFAICKSDIFKSSSNIIDVGTGAGFPGMPLAILYPDKEFTLMDSLNKRIVFLKKAVEELELKNVNCVHFRAEDMGNSKEYREKFDLCVSRAVARLSVLSEYCLPLVSVNGYFAAYKTKNEDLETAYNAIKILGGKLKKISEFPMLNISEEEYCFEHRIVYINKIKNTLKAYPRKSGTPSKNPL